MSEGEENDIRRGGNKVRRIARKLLKISPFPTITLSIVMENIDDH